MTDLFKLILDAWLRSSSREQSWQQKSWSCGNKINVLRRRTPRRPPA
jgi:hypothetical protein